MQYVNKALDPIAMLAACGATPRGDAVPDAGNAGSNTGSNTGSNSCATCYSVYAHSDTVLYVVDVQAKTLNTVGKFNAPSSDVITDLAVAPDDTIYVISNTALYTADATDGHVTKVGSLSACGSKGVALTTTPDGKLWTGDFMGTICEIDTTQTPPVVRGPISMASGMALSGDFVAVANGTVFGNYKKSNAAGQGTQVDNVLVKLDIATGPDRRGRGFAGRPRADRSACGGVSRSRRTRSHRPSRRRSAAGERRRRAPRSRRA